MAGMAEEADIAFSGAKGALAILANLESLCLARVNIT